MKTIIFSLNFRESLITYMSVIEEKRKIVLVDIETRYGEIVINYKHSHRLGIDEYEMSFDNLDEETKAILIGEAFYEGIISELPKREFVNFYKEYFLKLANFFKKRYIQE